MPSLALCRTRIYGCVTAPRARIGAVRVVALGQAMQAQTTAGADSDLASTTTLGRRSMFMGLAITAASASSLPSPAHAGKAKEDNAQTVVNDPIALRAQLEAQYQAWASGQFDAWLARQPDNIKWQTSYNGVPMKLKGKAGAAQYFAMLKADLDLKSYKPLAIFVDDDGDEATVVVEAGGTSRRTGQPFSTIFLHKYTVGPMGQILKFKEVTDTAVMAQIVPRPVEPTAEAGEQVANAPGPASAEAPAPVEPGSAARRV